MFLHTSNTYFVILLSSAYDGVVPARGKALLKTDLAIVVPPETYGRIGK